MEQPDFFAIPSPCIGVCRANNKGYCVGCLRSREERHNWLKMTDGERHQTMRLLALRRKKVEQAKWEKSRDFGAAPEQEDLDFDFD